MLIPGDGTMTVASYQDDIAAVLGVPAARAAAIAAEYPPAAYPSPAVAVRGTERRPGTGGLPGSG